MTEEDTEPRTDREEEDLVAFASDHPNSLCAHDMASKYGQPKFGQNGLAQVKYTRQNTFC